MPIFVGMRSIGVYLMLLMLLSSSFSPCGKLADSLVACEVSDTAVAKQSHCCSSSDPSPADSGNQESNNNCGPLCPCSCCHTSVIVPVVHLTIQPPTTYWLTTFSILDSQSFEFIDLIWQPPRLG